MKSDIIKINMKYSRMCLYLCVFGGGGVEGDICVCVWKLKNINTRYLPQYPASICPAVMVFLDPKAPSLLSAHTLSCSTQTLHSGAGSLHSAMCVYKCVCMQLTCMRVVYVYTCFSTNIIYRIVGNFGEH